MNESRGKKKRQLGRKVDKIERQRAEGQTERERERERECVRTCVCVCVCMYMCVPACVKEHERDPERAPNTVLAFHTPLCRNSTNLQKIPSGQNCLPVLCVHSSACSGSDCVL